MGKRIALEKLPDEETLIAVQHRMVGRFMEGFGTKFAATKDASTFVTGVAGTEATENIRQQLELIGAEADALFTEGGNRYFCLYLKSRYSVQIEI